MVKNKNDTGRTLAKKEHRYFYLFIAPWLLGFFTLTIGPMLYSFYCALCSWDAVSSPQFVGLRNYIKQFTANQDFWKSLQNTFVYAIFSVPSSLLVALMLAFLLNKKKFGAGFFQAIFYFPSIAAGTAVYTVWTWLFKSETGLINYLLSIIGIQGPKWLVSAEWAMPSLIIMNLTFCGTSMLIFLAGLKQVPITYYEAAIIDGASQFAQFRKITIPMISPIVLFNSIMGIISGLQIFNQPYIMTEGGPMKATYVYGMLIYDTGFRYGRFGEAASQSWVLFVIIIIITLLTLNLSIKKVFYDV